MEETQLDIKNDLIQNEELQDTTLSLDDYIANTEKIYLEKILKEHGMNISQAAKALNIKAGKVSQYRLRKHQVK